MKVNASTMRVITVLLIPLLTLLNGDGDKRTSKQVLFDRMVYLIETTSPLSGEWRYIKTDSIATGVFDLVYNTPDSEVSRVKKLDLIHLMVFYHDFATRTYRARLFYKIVRGDSSLLVQPEYVLPILYCHYCSDTKVLRALRRRGEVVVDTSLMPSVYSKYYTLYTKDLAAVSDSAAANPELTSDFSIQYYTYPVPPYLQEEYPPFKKYVVFPGAILKKK